MPKNFEYFETGIEQILMDQMRYSGYAVDPVVVKTYAALLAGYLGGAVIGDAVKGFGMLNQGVGRKIVGTDYSEIKPTQEIINRDKVDEYIAELKAGKDVGFVEVYKVQGKGYYISEGHHRFVASQESGIPVKIKYLDSGGPAGLPDWSGVEWREFINESQFWDY